MGERSQAIKLTPRMSYGCLLWDFTICVMTWKYFPRYWSFVRESPVTSGFPLQKTNSAEVWWSVWCWPVQAVKQAIKWPVIWDVMMFIWRSFKWEKIDSTSRYIATVLRIVKLPTTDPSNWWFVKIPNPIFVLINMFNAYNTTFPQRNLIQDNALYHFY